MLGVNPHHWCWFWMPPLKLPEIKIIYQYVMTYWMYQNKLPFTGGKTARGNRIDIEANALFLFQYNAFPFSLLFSAQPTAHAVLKLMWWKSCRKVVIVKAKRSPVRDIHMHCFYVRHIIVDCPNILLYPMKVWLNHIRGSKHERETNYEGPRCKVRVAIREYNSNLV